MHAYIHYMTDFIVKMSMNTSRIYMKSRLLDEYWDGLSAFIEVIKNYANSIGHISCLYIKCRNHEMLPVETVRAHIRDWF